MLIALAFVSRLKLARIVSCTFVDVKVLEFKDLDI
jgi:hypothetical protein